VVAFGLCYLKEDLMSMIKLWQYVGSSFAN